MKIEVKLRTIYNGELGRWTTVKELIEQAKEINAQTGACVGVYAGSGCDEQFIITRSGKEIYL